jgi:glycerol-3-phosphate cytidylyltransferase
MTGERVGFARGAFDLFHIGHLNLIRTAREHCDRLIVGVVTDEILQRSKGITPVVPLRERLEIVEGIRYVDSAIADAEDDPLATWRRVPFDVFFKGDDWRGTAKGGALEQKFARVGVEVVYFPYTVSTSSTILRRALDALA